jgi:hypothetical protein
MVALDGTSYASLENAFRYRSVLDAGCTCGTPALSRAGEPIDAGAETSAARLPEPRPAPGEDPETLLDRRGGLTTRHYAPPPIAAVGPPPPIAAVGPPPPKQVVRVILPAWNETPAAAVISAVPN